jgi:hypothetical protein
MRVVETDSGSRAALDLNLVSGVDEFADPRGHEAHSVLVDLDFFRYANFHISAPVTGGF